MRSLALPLTLDARTPATMTPARPRRSSVPFALLAVAALALPAAAAVTSAHAETIVRPADDLRQPVRYARVRQGGASVRNVADVQGVSILEVPANGLLAVYGERAGWLEVEAPGGFPVWVSGQFLEPTPQSGVVRVKSNGVNMRPSPSTTVNAYPLGRQLQAGDRLTVIEFADPTAELAKTWVRVWSPAGACGWVQAARTEPLPEDVDGAALWRQAEASLAEKAREGGGATRSSGTAAAKPSAAQAAFLAARAQLDAERANASPDFAAVRAAFEQVRTLEPDADLLAQIERALEMVDALAAAHSSQAKLASEQHRHQQELARRQERTWREAAARDPLDARFDARGRLERVEGTDGRVAYRVVRGSRAVALVVSPNGRYDLSLFVGCDLGIVGPIAVPEGAPEDALPRIEATRIEVLAARR